jgi:hypothetical protein
MEKDKSVLLEIAMRSTIKSIAWREPTLPGNTIMQFLDGMRIKEGRV